MPGWPSWKPATTLSRQRVTSDLVETGAGQCPALVSFARRKNLAAAKPAVKAIRDWPLDFGDSGYVVRYRFDGELVTIMAVRHQKEAGF